MSEEIKKNTLPTGRQEYITEEYLDKRFEEQTQVIVSAVGEIMEKRTREIREEVQAVRKELYIVRDELKEEIDASKEELKKDINNVQTLIDGYVKA